MRPVAMPISAPKPNSPPSANCVEALWSTIARVDLGEELLGGRLVVGDDRVGVVRAVALDVGDRARRRRRPPSTEMIASRYSVGQSSSVAGFARASALRAPRRRGPRSRRRAASRPAAGSSVGATARSTSSVSVAPQTPVRRILALSDDLLRHLEVGGLVDVDVADAFEMREHRHARLVLDALDQALAAARHDHVDRAVEAREHQRRPRRGRASARAGSRRPAGRRRAGPRPARRGSRAPSGSCPSRRAGSRRCRP